MKRFLVATCLICGALLLCCALLVPAHFRALDAAVIESAGKGRVGASTPTLVEEGITFLSVEKLGPAKVLFRSAQAEGVQRSALLSGGIAQFTRENPSLVALGGAAPLLDNAEVAPRSATEPQPIVDLLARRVPREKAFQFLQQSRRPGVQHMLQNRALTNTILFPPAMSSSGQALDAAILTAALLYQGDHYTATFRDAFEYLAMHANRGADPGPLELIYLDLLSLGRRLDWVSLTELMKYVDDIATLRDLAEAMRAKDDAVANIYSAVVLSRNGNGVAKYLTQFSETGLNDLSFALRNGRGAVELLLKQQQRVYYAGLRQKVVGYDPFGAFFYQMVPAVINSQVGALFLKYLFLGLGALCLTRAIGFLTASLEHRFGMRFAADSVFALAFAFVVALSIEPFIGAPSQNILPFRLQLPTLASAATVAKMQIITQSYMNQLSLTSLVVFFVLQALIYVWCLTKLAEIRRQPVTAHMKLKLLENEDQLFDAGLYVGFVCSVISLILLSIGLGKISMMAYASTAFGIIFVSVLKIFHVRPLRRRLIMESETQS
ncbi:MAG TPA: hypothetical protein VNT99_06010 [Methylomirabilota bacterium]|nr:hypothetical protein [Methylomirabilota bacterium]